MKKIDILVHKFSKIFIMTLFICILLGMLCINSVYLYIDMPSFQLNNIWNYLSIFITIISLIFIVWIYKLIKKKININSFIFALFSFYFILEFLYLKFVPLKPFSDMLNIVQVALSNFNEGMEYLYRCPNNLPMTLLFWLILKIYPKVFAIKLGNVVCNLLIIYFSYKIYNNIYKKDNKLVLLLGLTSIPMFLYVNHVYNDIIFTMLTTIVIYILTKHELKNKDIFLLSLLSFFQYIIRPVGIILIIAEGMYLILKKSNYKVLIVIVVTFIICNLLYIPLKKIYIPENQKNLQYPIWSYIQIGMNETEFGFQDGSFSTEWTAIDIINRCKDLGIKRLIKLFLKKEYWLWTEGTFQTERYAFGAGLQDSYEYETAITSYVLDPENSTIRKALDYLMKGQYIVLITLSLIGIIKEEKVEAVKNTKDLLFYFIIGMFCFYFFWEIKSRYIYSLLPIFWILAVDGLEKIKRLIK